MTRQTPNFVVVGSERYSIHACLPLLPSHDPRWERCNFVRGRTTANQRGYTAVWLIRDGSLFLKSFGGEVDAVTNKSCLRLSAVYGGGQTIQIGLLDVHEVETPVLATWISGDLECASSKTIGDWCDFVPCHFRLFRIDRGKIIAEVTVSNCDRIPDTCFPDASTRLDAEICRLRQIGAGRVHRQSSLSKLEGCFDLFSCARERQRLAALLWEANEFDLDVLMAGWSASHDSDVRRWIAYAIGRIGEVAASAVPRLAAEMEKEGDTDVVRALAYALASIGTPAAWTLPIMIRAIEAQCDHLENRHIQLLISKIFTNHNSSVELLIRGLLVTRSNNTRYQIAHSLGQIGTSAVPALLAAFKGATDDEDQFALAIALEQICGPASAAVTPLLASLERAQNDKMRRVFANALKAIGIRSLDSLITLRAVFRAAEDREALVAIAGAMASLGEEAAGGLIAEFGIAQNDVARYALIRALGEIGPAAAAAFERFVTGHPPLGGKALTAEFAETSQRVGASAAVTAELQIAALRIADDYEFKNILKCMVPGVIPSASAIQDMASLLLRQRDSSAGRRMSELLGAIGPSAVAPLASVLGRAPDDRARLPIVRALGLIGQRAAEATGGVVAALVAANSDDVRLQIVDDLRRIGQPDASHLNELLWVFDSSAYLPVQWRLGIILAGFGGPAVQMLTERLARTQDDVLRRVLGNALSSMGVIAASATPTLMKALEDARDPSTRQTLAQALTRVRPSVQRFILQ